MLLHVRIWWRIPHTPHTPPPLPPIMYITFAGAWFMQILICIALLNVLSPGWNHLKPIANIALHKILIVTFSLFYLLCCYDCQVHRWTTNKTKIIFYRATLGVSLFLACHGDTSFCTIHLFRCFCSPCNHILSKRCSKNPSMSPSVLFHWSCFKYADNYKKRKNEPKIFINFCSHQLSHCEVAPRKVVFLWVYLKPCANIQSRYLSGLPGVIFLMSFTRKCNFKNEA